MGTDRAITVTRVSDSSELADGDSYQHGEELRLTLSATDSYFIWEVTTDDLNTATSSSCAFDEYAKSPHLFFHSCRTRSQLRGNIISWNASFSP